MRLTLAFKLLAGSVRQTVMRHTPAFKLLAGFARQTDMRLTPAFKLLAGFARQTDMRLMLASMHWPVLPDRHETHASIQALAGSARQT